MWCELLYVLYVVAIKSTRERKAVWMHHIGTKSTEGVSRVQAPPWTICICQPCFESNRNQSTLCTPSR